jgi:hypothetical protein
VKESAPGESVFKRKPAPDLIRGESRFASRKRGPGFDFVDMEKALAPSCR